MTPTPEQREAHMRRELERANDARERIATALERIADVLDVDGAPPSLNERRMELRSEGRLSLGRPPLEVGDDRLLEELELLPRAHNCLRRAGYATIEQVEAATDEELLAIVNLGVGTLVEIRERLRDFRRAPE